MLVLTRKVNEAIVVGSDIVIRVLEVKGAGPRATVKLGIDAPRGTRVLREEVEAEIAREMTLAASARSDPGLVMRKVREKTEEPEKR